MDVKDVKAQMEKSLRSVKYAAKYGVGFTVPNPIVRKSKEESIDVLMKRLYTMPLPKGGGVVNAGGTNFDDDKGDEEEAVDEDDDDELASSIGSSHHSTSSAAGGSRIGGGGAKSPAVSGALSSVSDTSGPAAAGRGENNATGEKEEEDGVEEVVDDDGFGSLNITADRLPKEDSALSRFLKRALATNGEAAAGITGLKTSLEGQISMPRSEEEILADLDKRFYEPEFDPTRAVLESFPSEAAEFNLWVEKQLSEKDVARGHVMAELASHIEANYHALIEGMQNVQEVDLDLTHAGVQCVTSRQKLGNAARGVRDPLLRTLHKRRRRENLQRVAHIVKAARTVLQLVQEARASAADGRLDRAVAAATEARRALDGEALKDAAMMDGVGQTLDKLLPELRIEVDKRLRRLCSGKLEGSSFSSADYSWIIRAYLTLDDHGVRLHSKPRAAVSASALYEPTPGEAAKDSLAVGVVPIAPTVDRGGIPGLSERVQRFVAMELDYCIKAAVLHALVASPPPPPQPPTSPPPFPITGPEIVRDVHARVIAFKGRRLNAWAVVDLIRMLPPGASPAVLTRMAEGVAEALHRFYCITQWHRSSFDPQNEDPAILRRGLPARGPNVLNKQRSELPGALSDDEGDEDEEEAPGSPIKRRGKAAGAKKQGGDDGEEEEEEEEEEGEEEGGDEGFLDKPNEGKLLDEAEQARVLKERKGRLERARLATVARGLKQARKQLWAPVEKAVVALLKEAKEEVTMEGMVHTVAVCELLIALGEEFGRNDSAALKHLLQSKAHALLEKTHQECFLGVKQMLERETWFNVPISVSDLGGMAGVVGNHTRGLAWPAMNGWGGNIVKERLLANATKAAALSSPTAPAASSSPLTILAQFASKGNPFKPSPQPTTSQQQQQQQQGPLVFDASTITPPTSATPALPSPSPTSHEQQPLRPKPPTTWTITQAALNGPARFAGRYLQLMRLCPPLALEAHTALRQLLDLYVYAVCAFFVPEPSLHLVLQNGVGLNAEGTVVDELNWADREVYVPLPCELEEELAGVRAYVSRVRGELIEEEDHWEALAAEAATTLKKLGADTAKKLGALAAGQAALHSMMGGTKGGGNTGRGGGSPPPPQPPKAVSSAASSSSSRGRSLSPPAAAVPPPVVTGAVVMRSRGPSPTAPQAESVPAQQREGCAEEPGEEEEEGEEREGAKTPSGGGGGRRSGGGKASAGAPKQRLLVVKRVKLQRPAFVAEALEDPEALFGLSQRCVALESCAFVLELLRHLQPHILPLLPPPSEGGACDTFLDTAGEAVAQLRTLVLRAVAPKLVNAAGVAQAVAAQAWAGGGGRIVREEASAYAEELCTRCRAVWKQVEAAGRAQAGGLDATYIPPGCHAAVWAEVCQAAMAALLEGFARVEACGPEGRAAMSVDLQAVQSGLDGVQKARPLRGKAHVENYVRAFFYGEADLMAWAAQHHKAYFFRHVAGLLAASGAGQRLPKRRLRERIAQIEARYHPQPPEEESEQKEHQHQPAGAGAGGGRSPTGGGGLASAAASASSSFMSGVAKAADAFRIEI